MLCQQMLSQHYCYLRRSCNLKQTKRRVLLEGRGSSENILLGFNCTNNILGLAAGPGI